MLQYGRNTCRYVLLRHFFVACCFRKMVSINMAAKKVMPSIKYERMPVSIYGYTIAVSLHQSNN